MATKKYGKDSPERFIEGALTGGQGPSSGIHDYKIERKGQSIKTAVPMDNVKLAMHVPSSILDVDGIRGGPENLRHSLTGASAVGADDIGADGPLHHVVIEDH